MPSIKRIYLALFGITVLLGGGTMVFHFVENKDLLNSLYFTVITLTTVGYGDISPVTTQGKIASMFIIILGVSLFGILLANITEIVFEGRIRAVLGRKRMEKELAAIRDHFIVCGFGRIGGIVCRELKQSHVPFVVIENDEDRANRADEEQYLCVHGDATEDDLLLKAGIERARGLVAVLPSDADNVFITMSAREMKPGILIVARSEDERTSRKLARAGASRIVSPYEIGGIRMANAITRPNVIDFIEAATRAGSDLHLEEIPVSGQSDFVGQSLLESRIRQRFGVIIVAIRGADGRMRFNPEPGLVIESGSVLITMGPEHHQERLLEACGGEAPPL